MNRKFHQAFDFIVVNRNKLIGLGACKYSFLIVLLKSLKFISYSSLSGAWMTHRINSNTKQLERDTKEKKLYDPVKARAQIQVYKEIYNIGNDEDASQEEKDGALKIMKSASSDDKEAIKQYFELQRTRTGNQTQIDMEMEKLQ